jgi:ABC-type multidrug transport system ATPase subunit
VLGTVGGGPVVDARGLGFHYPKGRGGPDSAARGIFELNLECQAGEIIGLLGPNGAGKSTLLRLLATLVRPSSGELHLLGLPAVPPSNELRRRIGYAADEPVHLEPLSGMDNLVFFGRASGLATPTAADAARQLLARFGLAADARLPAASYSYGMRRKLLLCQTLVHSPRLVVLDEPTLGLDPPARETLADVLLERAAQGACVLLASQDVADARRLCTRVLFLDRGRIVLQGTPAALLADIGPGILLELTLDREPPSDFAPPDAEILPSTGPRVRLRSTLGSAALPGVCAALVQAGVQIHTIRIREPDLRDVFANLAPASAEPWPTSWDQ